MGHTSAAPPLPPEQIDPTCIGTLVVETGTSGPTKVRFTATRPFHRVRVIHLIYDLGESILTQARAEEFKAQSITFQCMALRSFAIMDDITECIWCAALDGHTPDNITLLQTLVSRIPWRGVCNLCLAWCDGWGRRGAGGLCSNRFPKTLKS